MAINTYRYRYTAEVEITVDDAIVTDRNIIEQADEAVEMFGDSMVYMDDGTEKILQIGNGVTGEVTKIGTWDRV